MAEETVVRLRIEQIVEGDEVVARVVAQTEKLAGAEARLAAQARPAAASTEKLRDAQGRFMKAAQDSIPKVDKLGDEIQQTGKQADTAGKQLRRAGADADHFGDLANKAGNKLKQALGAYLGFQAVRSIIMQAVDAISEAESTTALLGNRVVATGGMAERSAAQIEAASSRLSAALGVDDEAISQAADALLQYDRIAGDVFDRVTRTALDMSAGTQDAARSAEFLGKVLQDVEEGLPLLNRQWRLFSDAEEAAIVKLARSGKTVEAQNAVLDAMETRVGGAAAAWRDTLPGAISAASVEWENQLELLQAGLSPAIRELSEEFVRWSQSAEGQERIVQLGRDLGEALRTAAGITRILGDDLADLDTEALGEVLRLTLQVGEGIAFVVDKLDYTRDGLFWFFEQVGDGIANVREAAEAAGDAIRGMDPRAVAGAGAGIAASAGPGMTPAQRKAWDEAEAEAARAFERNRRAREDAAHRATEDTKRHAAAQRSAIEAAEKMVAAIEEEAARRGAGLAILQEEGRTREELAEAYREAEIQAKAEARVQEVRAAYLKAGKVLTEQNAAAIRAWVIEAERAADATAKWLTVTDKLPAVLEALPTQGLVIPARISFENFGQAGSTAPSVDVEAVISWLTISDEADAANEQMWADWTEQQGQSLEELAEGFRASLASPRDELETTMRAIDALAQAADDAGEPLLSAAEAERLRADAVAAYTMQQLDQQMAAWGGFFSYLGSAFGGVVQQIASAIQSIQGGISTGQGLGQAMGGTASAAAAGGAAGAIVAVVIEAYKYFKSEAAKRKAESYGYGAAIGKSAGYDWSSPLTNEGRRASMQIRDTLEALAEVMGGVIKSFADIEIKVRRDGKYFHAFVEDFFVGSFTDMQSAIEASILRALKNPGTTFAGVSELIQQGLQYALSDGVVKVGTLEELQEFLAQIREISDLDLSPGAVQLQETLRHLDRLWGALSRLSSASPEAIRGLENLGASIVSAWQDWADSISGRQKTPKEILAAKEREKVIFEEQQKLFLAEQRLRVLDLKHEAEVLKAGGALASAGNRVDQERIKAKIRFLEGLVSLTEAEAAVESERLALIEAQIAAIEAIIAEVEKIDIGDITIPRGGGGLGRDLKGEREDLRRELARIMAESRGSLHLIFFDLEASIADLTKRWKEAKLPLADLTAGIAALTAAAQKQAKQRMDELAGVGTDFTRSLQEGLDFFREMRELGRGKTGVPDWKVDVRERQFKERMQADLQARLAEFGGVANPMLEITANAARLEQELTALAEATGMSAEEIAAARAQIAEGKEFQREQAISGIIGQLFGYLKGSQKHAADIEKFERRQIELQFKIWEAQLKFLQAWDAETAELLADAKEAALAMDRGAQATDRFASRMEAYWQAQQDAADRWKRAMEAGAQAVQEWRSAVKEWSDSTQALLTDESQTNLTQAQQLAEAERRYGELLARAQGGDAGAVRELIRARAEWIAEGRESFGGGAGFDEIWRRILETSGSFLETAQAQEDDIFQQAFQEAMVAEAQNAEKITVAVYDAAQIVANKIDELLAGMPSYASGGVLSFPHMARVGETPEAIVPLAGGGVPVSWIGGPPSPSGASMAPVVSLLAAMERRLARVEDHLGNVSESAEDIATTNKQMATEEGRLASEVKRLKGGNRQRR